MDRLERLVNLLAALIDTPRPLGRDEIRTRVPGYSQDDVAFRRAFERDKETLRSMGVALITEPLDADYPDHGDGYRVPPEQYALPDPGLTREEMDALALAASAIKLRSDAANSALGKLGGETRQSTGAVDLNDDARLAALFSARSERRSVSFAYKAKARQLDPYRLSFRNGNWYVNGFDHAYQDVRTYRIDRIEGDVTTGDVGAFNPPPPTVQPWLQPWQLGDETPVNADVLVDSSQAAFAVEQVGADAVSQRRDDGSVVLRLEVTNRDGLRAFVLGFLDHAELLAPAELRADLVAYLETLVAP